MCCKCHAYPRLPSGVLGCPRLVVLGYGMGVGFGFGLGVYCRTISRTWLRVKKLSFFFNYVAVSMIKPMVYFVRKRL